MDQGVGTTQKIVITIAILLGLLLVMLVGYSLWQRAKAAESELAQKQALDAVAQKAETSASVSITNEANNPSNFSFESLTNNSNNLVDTGTDNTEFAVLATTTPDEETIVATKTITTVKKPVTTVKKKTVYYNYDRPLTAEEIRKIRMLPIDGSATGQLQNKLETETNGQYKAQYQ